MGKAHAIFAGSLRFMDQGIDYVFVLGANFLL